MGAPGARRVSPGRAAVGSLTAAVARVGRGLGRGEVALHDVFHRITAAMDSGRRIFGRRVRTPKKLFRVIDGDGSGTITFEEYCHFIQVYRAKQSWWERLMESAMDCLSPKPSYLTNPTLRFVRKARDRLWRSGSRPPISSTQPPHPVIR